MKLQRFVLRPQSPWGTALRSDTLYGLLLWRIAEKYGPEKCSQTINAFRAEEPVFVLSSAMPAHCVPMPCLPPAPRRMFRQWLADGVFRTTSEAKDPLFAALDKFKDFRKESYLPLAVWTKYANRLSIRDLFDWYCDDRQERYPKSQEQAFEPHVRIDRMNNGAAEGGLFYTRLCYFKDAAFHLYARTAEPDYLLELLTLVGELGFGRDASIGKGRFTVELDKDFDPASLELPELAQGPGTCRLLLSICASPDMSAIDGWYRTEVKRGKAGPGVVSPFKNPFLCLKEGSILRSLPQGPHLLHIHQDPAIVQITQPLTLPCRLTEEGTDHD